MSTFVLIVSRSGVNDTVAVADDDEVHLDRVRRWEPGVRLGRIDWQDYGYKRAVVSEDGLRVYELFEVPS